MINKILLPLIICLILVAPGYPKIAPVKAPPPSSGKISSPKGSSNLVIVIRTAKDPKEQKTRVGKNGEIIIPQSTAMILIGKSVSGQSNQTAAGSPQTAGTAKEDPAADEGQGQDKSEDTAGSRSFSGNTGIGDDHASQGRGEDNPTGGFASSPTATDPGLVAGGFPSDVTAVSTPAPITPVVPPTIPSTELQALLDQSVSDNGVPGAIVAVQTRWGSWIGAAGKANLDTEEAMTTDMQVRLAGSTKLFTAALIMKLVEDNKISLTDTVDKWVPGQVWNGDLITVAMLLNHTSGVHDHETTPEFVDSLIWGPTIPWTSDDIMWITDSYLPDFDPGTQFEFSNTNYYLLGMIAEAATGETVENLVQDRFFTSLGLTRTALTRSGLKTEPYSREYCWFGTPEYPTLIETSDWDLSFDWTSGSGVSTAQDMLTWIKALFKGQVVNTQSLAQMTTPQAPATTYGYGLEVENPDSRYGELMYTHLGENPGVYTRWLYFPKSGRIIFIALNRCDKRYLSADPPPEVEASQVADSLLDGISSLLIQTQSQ